MLMFLYLLLVKLFHCDRNGNYGINRSGVSKRVKGTASRVASNFVLRVHILCVRHELGDDEQKRFAQIDGSRLDRGRETRPTRRPHTCANRKGDVRRKPRSPGDGQDELFESPAESFTDAFRKRSGCYLKVRNLLLMCICKVYIMSCFDSSELAAKYLPKLLETYCKREYPFNTAATLMNMVTHT